MFYPAAHALQHFIIINVMYSAGCIIVAQHSKWRRMRRQAAGTRVRFEQRNIFFNQTVNYTGNTISVFDVDNNTVVE